MVSKFGAVHVCGMLKSAEFEFEKVEGEVGSGWFRSSLLRLLIIGEEL